MATLLNTSIRGEQIEHATISGVHIVDASISPVKVDVYNSPLDGDVLTYKSATDQFEWNSIGTMVVNESPSGAINGTNTTFTLSDTPVGNTLSVFLNGVLQQPGVGNDYTASGNIITFTVPPETGDIILCNYLISAGLGGGIYTDHGNLDGLGDDDHLQYMLVDGSRAFTGPVAGVNPTIASHLATKGYVDDELDNQTHDASDIISGTFSDDRIAQSNVTQYVNVLDHNQLLNTHNLTSDIDHNTLKNYSIDEHRVINDNSTSPTDLWSAAKISSELSLLSKDSITEGDSKVEVVDTGTGYVTVEVDGFETVRFNTSNVTVASNILPDMTGASGTVSVRDIGSSSAKFNRIYCHDLLADAGSIYVNSKKVIEDVSDVITISTDVGQRLKIATLGDSGDVYIEGQGGIQLHIPSDSSNKDITLSNESPSGQINIGGSSQVVKITGNVDLTNGFISHTDLTNLDSDDHHQYILSDGSRSFTGVVAGIMPVADSHLATKGYVDSVVQGLDWQDSVKDKDLNSPPSSPTLGDRYLIANGATGSWAGHDGDIAEYNGTNWDYYAKSEGMAVWIEDEDILYTYNGSNWVRFGSTITHNNTSGLQGGISGEYYHLSSSQYTDLTDGGNSSSHKHDDRYYTESELDSGQLDNRYYTKTEVDTWRNGTTQTEMGYLHGVSSDIQTQLDGKLDNTGAVTHTGEIRITGTTKADGYFYGGTTDPTNSTRLNYDGYFYATKVYNAVYNDIADFQKVADKIEYGKCYYDTNEGAKICTERCQMAVIGIASDTFGFGVGNTKDEFYAPFAVAGWVLAYVDKEYPPGTPLTNDENGMLTEMLPSEKREFPERLVAIYKKKEMSEFWGPNNEVKVNGRHWVKVK